MAENNLAKMKALIIRLREADTAYFRDDAPVMTDREYDALTTELKELEALTGVVFADSPTKKVPGEVKEGLAQVKHSKPMLSAEKTKSVGSVVRFINKKSAVLSWKMDGLTLVLRYENGLFKQAITRGSDGIVGEDVTHSVRYFRNLPHKVSRKTPFEVRGEGVISWADFELLSKRSAEQAHPRNVAAGAVRSLTADRSKCSKLEFFAFELIDGNSSSATKAEQLDELASLGFTVVPHVLIAEKTGSADISETIATFKPEDFPYPADGVMAEYNDLDYGKSLGATAHHEKRMLALKWQDELCETVFRGVDLVTTRSGIVSIVAKFDPVCIEGSTVQRASLHNLSIFEKFSFGIGDTISVYKANMIIPQVAENHTRSGNYSLPTRCTCCGETLTVKTSQGGVRNLYCPNESCIARNAQKIARFCDKNAMNIEGLSAVTLEKLMAYGWVRSFRDLYHLDEHRDDIAATPGFGIASYEKLHEAAEKSRSCRLSGFLVGLGIPLLGPEAAKTLEQYFYGSWKSFEDALQKHHQLSRIYGISSVLEENIYKWYADKTEEQLWRPLLSELHFAESHPMSGPVSSFYDQNVVVTGTMPNMSRKEINEILTLLGAKVSDSVSRNTDILIVGMMPGSKKLGAAMKNGTKILTASQFASVLQKG